MMANASAIVIVIDRLGAGFLGPYGNTWSETPAFNRLATESCLWENCFAEAPSLDGFYRGVLFGRHPLGTASDAEGEGIIERIAAAGVRTVLVTDEPELDQHPFIRGFTDRVVVPTAAAVSAAEAVEDTQAAHLFAAALESLEQLPAPYLLWIHLRGMSGAWDAPREFRERFADEEDPPPPEFTSPPDRRLTEDVDPDEILGMNQAYAGQVMLNDLCLSTFLDAIQGNSQMTDTLLMVTSPRGYALGEHGGVGPSGDGLFEEVTHLPLLIRLPSAENAMHRSQRLVTPSDLFATLGHWFAIESIQSSRSEGLLTGRAAEAERRFLVLTHEKDRALRTKSWLVIQSMGDGEQSAGEALGPVGTQRCYVKPDDRWEVNEVGNRRGDIVELAVQAIAAFEESARSNRQFQVGELGSSLLESAE